MEQNTNGGVVMSNAEITIGPVTYEIYRQYTGEKTALDLIKESLMLEEKPQSAFDTTAHDGV